MKKRTEIRLPGHDEPISHYCDAVQFGDLLYISGIVSIDEHNQVIAPGDVVAQTEIIFRTMQKILNAAGAGFEDILKVTVYMTNISDRPKINPIRQKYFATARPASTLVEVSALVFPELMLEIEAVVGIPA